MNARVQYIISADDKTRSAIASINRNFKDMERGVKGTLKGLNVALGLFAGVQLKQAFQKVLQATAESEAGARNFGKALSEVREAARELLVAKSGLPEATKAMQELRDTLKDPGIVAAADSLTSALIQGFANASRKLAEFAGGLRNLAVRGGIADPVGRQETIEAIDGQLKEKTELLRGLNIQLQSAAKGSGYETEVRKRIAVLNEEIAALTRRQQLLIDYSPSSGPGRRGAVGGTGLGSGINATVAARGADRAGRDAAKREVQSFNDYLKELQAETYDFLDEEFGDSTKDLMNDANRDAEKALDELHSRFEKWKDATAETIGELSPFADQAARNMQDAFADFLFDPFEGGIKGMLKSFVDILRRMVAEAAAAKIFEALGFGQGGRSGGGGGLLGGLGNVLQSITGIGGPIRIPGRAAGGPVTGGFPYIVGERGPELFVPRASGSIVPNGRMGGVTYAPVYNFSGTSQELAQFRAYVDQKDRQTIAEMASLIRGGAFA